MGAVMAGECVSMVLGDPEQPTRHCARTTTDPAHVGPPPGTTGGAHPDPPLGRRAQPSGPAGDETRLTRVGGLLGSVNETASFAGPAIGGLLVTLIGPAAVLLIDAGSFLAAFLLVALLVPAIPGTEVTEEGRSSFRGLRYIARDRALVRRVIGVAIIEIGWAAMMATLPVRAFR